MQDDLKEERVELVDYPGYSITRSGKVFSPSGKLLKVSYPTDNRGYPTVALEGTSRVLHRLLALAFIPNDDPDNKIQVNHKDGVKDNFDLDNLEWVTPSGNLIHAFETGLRTDNTPLEVKDLRTGEVLEFYGIQECGRHFKVTGAAILHYLKDHPETKLLANFYLIRKKGDPWPDYDPNQIGAFPKGTPKPLLAYHIETKKKIIFMHNDLAAERLGIKYNTLAMHIRRHKAKPYHGFVFSYIDNIFELEELMKVYEVVDRPIERTVNYVQNKLPIPIEVTDRLGFKEVWESSEAFCKAHGVNKGSFQGAVWLTGRWREYKVRYLR